MTLTTALINLAMPQINAGLSEPTPTLACAYSFLANQVLHDEDDETLESANMPVNQWMCSKSLPASPFVRWEFGVMRGDRAALAYAASRVPGGVKTVRPSRLLTEAIPRNIAAEV